MEAGASLGPCGTGSASCSLEVCPRPWGESQEHPAPSLPSPRVPQQELSGGGGLQGFKAQAVEAHGLGVNTGR